MNRPEDRLNRLMSSMASNASREPQEDIREDAVSLRGNPLKDGYPEELVEQREGTFLEPATAVRQERQQPKFSYGATMDLLRRPVSLLGVDVLPMRMSHYAILCEQKNPFVAEIERLSEEERNELTELEESEARGPDEEKRLARLQAKKERVNRAVSNPYYSVLEFISVVSLPGKTAAELVKDKDAFEEYMLEVGDLVSCELDQSASKAIVDYMDESKATRVEPASTGKTGGSRKGFLTKQARRGGTG